MDKKYVIKAEKRVLVGKKANVLRREGKLPGVVYGKKFEPIALTMDLRDTSKLLSSLTPSSVINIDIEGKDVLALVRDKQRDVVYGQLTHIDFQAVDEKEPIRASIAIKIVGESPAVKNFNGLLVKGATTIDVECLPKDLPEYFEINLSKLKKIGSSVSVGDLKINDNVKVLANDSVMLVLVTGRGGAIVGGADEDLEGAEEGAAEPEVMSKGKQDEE
jgi:large subunit ribosomal protein L25